MMHCIQSIHMKAEDISGVTCNELYKIDEINLVETLGEATFITLCGIIAVCILTNRVYTKT